MIDGRWSTEEMVEAFNNGVMEKVWPNLYQAMKTAARPAKTEKEQMIAWLLREKMEAEETSTGDLIIEGQYTRTVLVFRVKDGTLYSIHSEET